MRFSSTTRRIQPDEEGGYVLTLTGRPLTVVRLGLRNLDGDTEEGAGLAITDATGLVAFNTDWDGNISVPFDRFVEYQYTPLLINDGTTTEGGETYSGDVPLICPVTLTFGNLNPANAYETLVVLMS